MGALEEPLETVPLRRLYRASKVGEEGSQLNCGDFHAP